MRRQVYGRRSDEGPPHAVGVTHFDASADTVAAFLFDPANMSDWDSELCEKSQARQRTVARRAHCAALARHASHHARGRCCAR
jgi:hypothetical protein